MSSRPGRKIARGQAQRERAHRPTVSETHERRRRSAIVMGIVLLTVTVGVVSALLWSRRDTDDDPDLEVTTPLTAPVDTTLLPADATTTVLLTDTTLLPADATTTVLTDSSTTTVLADR